MVNLVRSGRTRDAFAPGHGGSFRSALSVCPRAVAGCIAALGLAFCVAGARAADRPGSSVPWEAVAELLPDAGGPSGAGPSSSTAGIRALACNGDPTETACNYACPPDQPVLLKLTVGSETLKVGTQTPADLALWMGSSWRTLQQITVDVVENRITTRRRISEDGLYRLTLVPQTPDGGRPPLEVSFLVAANWKADLLAYCRQARDRIELNADPELIRASIAVSHWDHIMELAAPASALSEDLLTALRRAVRASAAFHAGDCPDLVTGLTKVRLKRFPGARMEEFAVCVPNDYTDARKWPVFLHSDNQRWSIRDKFNRRSGLIDVWWHTVTDKDIDWKAYDAIWDLLRRKLNLDEDRMYVTGECRHALAAMSLALTRPDRWAECSVSLANTYRHLAGNARNLRMVYARGGYREEGWAAGSYDFAVKCFRYFGCEHLVASDAADADQARGCLVPDAVRIRTPQRLSLNIESLDNAQAYWARIDGREDENSLARLNVSVEDREVRVETNNVDAYTLFLAQAPLDVNQQIRIIENDKPLGHAQDPVFTRRSPKYDGANAVKNGRLHGPIWDAFTDRYVVLWGSGSDDKTVHSLGKGVAEALARGAPCMVDTSAPEELVGTHNIILIGEPAKAHWPARLMDALALDVAPSRIVALGKDYQGANLGIILIHPNPLNPDRYVVVFAGTSTVALRHMQSAYSQLQSLRPADVALFEVDGDGTLRWHVFEQLSTVWGWHGAWDQVLMQTGKAHPPWQWRQWVCNVLQQHYAADVAICENPLWFDASVPAGPVTYRQMSNTFKDYWLVKVRINGKELRQLLMAPFTGTAAQEVNKPTIAGIRLFNAGPRSRQDGLSIQQLEKDKKYLLVCNYKCLNGTRMGQYVKDYEIIADGCLVTALRDYLSGPDASRDIDAQLDSLQVEIY